MYANRFFLSLQVQPFNQGLNKGEYNGKRLLSPNSIHVMTINQIGDINLGRAAKFGLGFQVLTEADEARNTASLGSFSWGGMFASSYCRLLSLPTLNDHSLSTIDHYLLQD